MPEAADIQFVPFSKPNISKARNLSVALAAGEIVVFIDDNAVPEPTWLGHLVAPFVEPDVAAAGGFVRGRNGISWQWCAESVDRIGVATEIPLESDKTVILCPNPTRAIRRQGTYMAFRPAGFADLWGLIRVIGFFSRKPISTSGWLNARAA